MIQKKSLIVTTYYTAAIKGLYEFDFAAFAKKLIFGKNAQGLISFSGGYTASSAHIDAMMFGYNFYTLIEGKKHVHLIPPEYTQYVSLGYAVDNVYVKAEKQNPNDLSWLNNVPNYYDFELNKNETLIFNNSGMIHKFENIIGNEMAYSLRFENEKTSSSLSCHNVLKYGKQFADDSTSYMLNGSVVRTASLT
eukprot:66148_1